MSSALAVWLLVALFMYLLWSGIRFHRGSDRRGLFIYRSPNLPRALRNFELVAPVAMALLVPITIAAAIFVTVPFDNGPSQEVRGVALVGAGYFFFTLTVTSVMLFRPPARLTPAWLVEDDQAVGYVAPPPRLEDWFWLIFVVVATSLLGIAAVSLGVNTYLTGP